MARSCVRGRGRNFQKRAVRSKAGNVTKSWKTSAHNASHVASFLQGPRKQGKISERERTPSETESKTTIVCSENGQRNHLFWIASRLCSLSTRARPAADHHAARSPTAGTGGAGTPDAGPSQAGSDAQHSLTSARHSWDVAAHTRCSHSARRRLGRSLVSHVTLTRRHSSSGASCADAHRACAGPS